MARLHNWRFLKRRGWLSSFLPMERTDSRPVTGFHGAFIPEVASYFLERLGEDCPDFWVWDPMAGSGTTGIVAHEMGLNALLTDLNPVLITVEGYPMAKQIARGDAFSVRIVKGAGGGPEVRNDLASPHLAGDTDRSLETRAELDRLETFLFDLIIWHPPYSNIIRFSDNERDLSTAESHDSFLGMFEVCCYNIIRHLKPGGYIGLVMGDAWVNGEAQVFPMGFETMRVLQNVMTFGLGGFSPARLKAIAVKDIKGNRPDRGYHLRLSRLARWGANDFKHEYLFTLQMGQKKG